MSFKEFAILRQCAQAVANVIGRHVPSHSGFAGNELADLSTKFAGKHPEHDDLVARPRWPSLLMKHAFAEWSWLALSGQSDLPALGAFESEDSGDGASVRPLTEARVRLHLCSFNVLSLRESDALPQGLAVIGKRALLKQQFLHLQLHAGAFQETRTKGDCLQPDSDFIMLHSSCDQHGCFGCALWLSKRLPVVSSGQRRACFTKEICTVLISEPRLLIVQVDLPGLPLTLVSAHAPHEGHKTRNANEFWQKVGAAVATRPSGSQLVVLTDSNGHLGSATSDALGTAGAECENVAGVAFHTFLVESGLCVPSTFQDLHAGGHSTWKIGSASSHRLDYIAVPQDWLIGKLASRVWYDFDHVHDVDDHQPVLLACELLRHNAARTHVPVAFKAPRPQPDTDPGQLQCFLHAVATLPSVGWHVDVDMHYASFVRSVLV